MPEVLFAAAILAVTSTSLYGLYSHTLKVVSAGDNAAIAQQHTLAKLELLKNAKWGNVVKPTYISGTVMATPANTTFTTPVGFTQVISVYPMTVPLTAPTPNPTPSATPVAGATPYFTVTRTAASITVNPAGFDYNTIIGEKQLRYRVTSQWTCWGKTHTRELSTVISKNGSR